MARHTVAHSARRPINPRFRGRRRSTGGARRLVVCGGLVAAGHLATGAPRARTPVRGQLFGRAGSGERWKLFGRSYEPVSTCGKRRRNSGARRRKLSQS